MGSTPALDPPASAGTAAASGASEPAPAMSGREALLARHPRLAAIPWTPLLDGPTPIEHAVSLGRALGIAELWVKRDDRSSAIFGGSKARKLEFLLADAKARGHREVVTFGAVGSNHAVATAAFGRELGLGVTLRLASQPGSDDVRRKLRACIRFGARVEAIGGVADAFAIAERAARSGPASGVPYVIAPGGSSRVGHLGLVSAAFELAAQVASGRMPKPDLLVAAVGTMGSVAGLAVGLGAVGLDTEILAVRCSSPASSSEPALLSMTRELGEWLRARDPGFPRRVTRIHFEEGFIGPGYGARTKKAGAAIALAAKHEGYALEMTYTGKALAALAARAGVLRAKTVLFWASQPVLAEGDDDGVDCGSLPSALARVCRD